MWGIIILNQIGPGRNEALVKFNFIWNFKDEPPYFAYVEPNRLSWMCPVLALRSGRFEILVFREKNLEKRQKWYRKFEKSSISSKKGDSKTLPAVIWTHARMKAIWTRMTGPLENLSCKFLAKNIPNHSFRIKKLEVIVSTKQFPFNLEWVWIRCVFLTTVSLTKYSC